MLNRSLLGVLVLALAACAAPSPPSDAPVRLRFALVGDAPYGAGEVPGWTGWLQQLAGEGNAFILHAGDIKGGGEPCSDALLAERIEQLRQLPAPLLLAPGDNDWTDCHRRSAGSFSPLERLSRLRALAYADPTRSLGGHPMLLESQASRGGLPEHQAFESRGVRVASLHVVGSRNGLEPWSDIGDGVRDSSTRPRADRLAEWRRRDAAVREWLRFNMERAASPEVQALVLLFQANPGLERPAGDAARIGFEAFLDDLRAQAQRLRKPILLAHGDFHTYRADQPWPELPWVQRVQTWGSPLLGGVRVRVLEGTPLRFELQSVFAR